MGPEMEGNAAVTTTSEAGGVVVIDVSGSSRPQQQDAEGTDEESAAPSGRPKTVVKTYRHDCDRGCCPVRWTRHRTVEDANRELAKSLAHVPILHRQFRRRGRGRGDWTTLNFVVQNREMRAVLARALARYQDFRPDLAGWTFAPPFQPLVHRWETLRELQAEITAEAEAVQLANRDARLDVATGAGNVADVNDAAVQAEADERERKAVEKRRLVDELVAFVQPLLAPSIASRDQTLKTGKVEFDDVWQLFPPGALVVTKLYGADVICRVAEYRQLWGRLAEEPRKGSGPRPYWSITAEYVDWDGESCGWASTCCNILEFAGFRAVDSFPVVPLDQRPDADALKASLVARGRKFEALRGYHYRSCEGPRIAAEVSFDKDSTVAGRVVVDAMAYCSINRYRVGLSPLRPKEADLCPAASSSRTSKAGDDDDDDASSTSTASTSTSSTSSEILDEDDPRPNARRPPPIHPRNLGMPVPRRDAVPPGALNRPPPANAFFARPPPGHAGAMPMRARPMGAPRPLPGCIPTPSEGPLPTIVYEGTDKRVASSLWQIADSRKEDLAPLTDEECMLATPWVRGFDMKAKDWGLFNVDDIHEVDWNDDAFDKLVLPDGSKELAWAFVENKSVEKDAFDDFVRNKGRGLIILLFGPPGVGKTYTAEAVAERSRVPLYSMSAAVLGTDPHDVELRLDRALELCRLWKAMLLLDEADIFLSARNDQSLTRNELVALFLTKLEYYHGTIFLTTNRIAALDHAFQSRVDLFLPYHDLTPSARRQVWANFVAHLGPDRFELEDSDLDRLAQIPLNGREIKSLIKSACLLSAKGGEKIPAARLLTLAEGRVKATESLVKARGLGGVI